MNRLQQISNLLAVLGLLAFSSEALAGRSYSSGGGHSYSSHSSSSHSSSSGSHSFSSGGSRSSSSSSRSSSSSSGSKSFTSSSGKSYGSSSKSNNDGRHSYTANKSYSSGPSHSFGPNDGKGGPAPPAQPARNSRPNNPSSDFTFDTAAARARKEQASKEQFTQFKERQAGGSPSYNVKPPPIRTSDNYYHRTVYVPDTVVIRTRPTRIYTVFSPYWYRPVVYYNDPYNSFFWWWLLDRTIDDQAWWAYHHRYNMDPARYDALLARDQQLEARVAQLEAQQVPRDPNYVPQGLDRDLMYSDQYVNQAYHNRTTTSGTVAFWLFGVPTAIAVCAFFIWLIWFKRWQTATT